MHVYKYKQKHFYQVINIEQTKENVSSHYVIIKHYELIFFNVFHVQKNLSFKYQIYLLLKHEEV
jgi:hypothetical protein